MDLSTDIDSADDPVTDLYFGTSILADPMDGGGAPARMLAQATTGGRTRVEYLGEIGRLAVQAGRYDDAWCYLERVLELQRKASAPEPAVAQTYCRLAVVAARRHDLDAACDLLERAESLAPAIRPSVLHNRGCLARQAGDLDKAESLYAEALSLKLELCGREHPAVAATLCARGRLLLARAQPRVALGDLFEARRIYEVCARAVSNGMAVALTAMGRAYLMLEMYEHATAALERALAIREALPVPPEQLACSRYYLTQALWPRRPDEARALARITLDEYGREASAQARHVRILQAWIERNCPESETKP